MKIRLSELHPNPFKKEISNGELSKEQVEKIKANIKELGFFGSLPVFKKDDKFYLIAGHHRSQALKEIYGKDFEVQVTISDYNEDQVFKGMVIENITQRGTEFMELNENIVAIENYLNGHKEILQALRESRKGSKHSPLLSEQKGLEKATSNDISYWIDKSKEEVISHDVITQNLNIYHKLDPTLRKGVEKKHNKSKEERAEDNLNYTQAVILSGIKDENNKPDYPEQKKLAKVLNETREQRVRNQSELISEYKVAPPEIKDKIKEGRIDLADIKIEVAKYDLEQAKKNKPVKEKGDEEKINEFLNYLSFSTSDVETNVKQVIKYLAILSKYISKMDSKQKGKLDGLLKRLENFFGRAEELMSNIRERI